MRALGGSKSLRPRVVSRVVPNGSGMLVRS